MQYVPVMWMFAPYLSEKCYYIIENKEYIFKKFIKGLYVTSRLQRDDLDNRRRDAGTRGDGIGNSGNSGKNGNGGDDHSGAVARGPNGNEGARGPAGGREWANHVGVRHTLGSKSQDKNAAKP